MRTIFYCIANRPLTLGHVKSYRQRNGKALIYFLPTGDNKKLFTLSKTFLSSSINEFSYEAIVTKRSNAT